MAEHGVQARAAHPGRRVEADLKWSPDGSRLGFLKGRGDLWVMDPDGKDAKRLVESFEPTRFDWSPDGKWIVYAQSDDDFNEDIWVAARRRLATAVQPLAASRTTKATPSGRPTAR